MPPTGSPQLLPAAQWPNSDPSSVPYSWLNTWARRSPAAPTHENEVGLPHSHLCAQDTGVPSSRTQLILRASISPHRLISQPHLGILKRFIKAFSQQNSNLLPKMNSAAIRGMQKQLQASLKTMFSFSPSINFCQEASDGDRRT